MPEASPNSRESAMRKRRGAGRPAARDVAGRMENLLDVATDVFLRRGYEHANVSEIARRAGASKGTIYSRYPSKAELFAAVITRKMNKLQAASSETLVSQIPLKKVLENYGVRLVMGITNSETRSLYRIFIAVSAKFPRLAYNFWNVGPQRSMTTVRDYLARHPEFKGKHPELAAEKFWALCCGHTVLRALLQEEDDTPEEVIRFKVKEATRIFLSAYT